MSFSNILRVIKAYYPIGKEKKQEETFGQA